MKCSRTKKKYDIMYQLMYHLTLLIYFDWFPLDLFKYAPQAPVPTLVYIKLLISATLSFPFFTQKLLHLILFVNNLFSYKYVCPGTLSLVINLTLCQATSVLIYTKSVHWKELHAFLTLISRSAILNQDVSTHFCVASFLRLCWQVFF